MAIAAASACSLTTSLDGFSGGEATAPPSEGGPSLEGGASLESGAETGSGEGGGGTFCSTASPTLTFCEDFDVGAFPPAGFRVKVANGGTVTLDGDAKSAPKSALFTAIPANATLSVAASIARPLGPATKSVVVELHVRVDLRGPNKFDFITIDANAPEVGLQLEEDGTVSWDEDIVQSTSIVTPTGLTIGSAWTHVRVAFAINGMDAVATLSVDGGPQVTHTFKSTALVSTTGNLVLGDDSLSNPGSGWRVRVDNVTVETR